MVMISLQMADNGSVAWWLQAAACTARNLDSMLLTKNAALSMFTLELLLEGMPYMTLMLHKPEYSHVLDCLDFMNI